MFDKVGEDRENLLMLNLENIQAGYGKKEILRGISISVSQGEIVALVGPNGAGKSTILKVITGFVKQTSGNVFMCGKEISSLKTFARVQNGVGYFMQGGAIFPTLTVHENLQIGMIDKKRDQTRSEDEIFTIFPDLNALLNRRAGLLSGGQRQQLALAMILSKKPSLLLLDEPSAGLAPNLVSDAMKKVREINTRFGITTVIVEQNIREVFEIAHKAVIIVNGIKMLEDENTGQLLESKLLEKYFFASGNKQ